MIDEELYQQAADELNSDKRRAHIWARACALASDDHDEARYLYTNLRVEELIAERDAGGSSAHQQFQNDEHDATLALEPIVVNDAPDEDEMFLSDSLDSFSLDADDTIPESISAPSGIDSSAETDDLLDLLDDHDDSEHAAISSVGASFDERVDLHQQQRGDSQTLDQLDTQDQHDSDAAGNTEFSDINEHSSSNAQFSDINELSSSDADADLAGINDDKSLEEDFLDSYAEHQQNIKDTARAEEQSAEEFISELGLDEEELRDHQRPESAHDEMQLDFDSTTELDLTAEEIARINDSSPGALSSIDGEALFDEQASLDDLTQAREEQNLDWLDEDIPPSKSIASIDERLHDDIDLEDDRLAQEFERQADELPGQRSDVIEHTDLVEEAYPDAVEETQEAAFAAHDDSYSATAASVISKQVDAVPFNLPVDLTLNQSGREYAIYKRDYLSQAVSTGFSWSALFLTLPFLIYRHMFGTAIVYTILSLITLGGLIVSGLAWMDAGSTASALIKISTIGFALLAFIGLLYMPFRYGNHWRGEKLEQRGFELVAWVKASSPGKALSQARRASALD
ncbi:MAG: hypothetical protein AB8B79_11040 [Granulosicoccus sp.]